MSKVKEILKNPTFLFSIYTLIAPFVGSIFLSVYLINYSDFIVHMTERQIVIFLFVISMALSFSLIHSSVICLLFGYLLGFFGIIPVLLIYLLALAVGRFITKLLDKDKVKSLVEAKMKPNHKELFFVKMGFWSVFTVRLLPVLPFGTTTLALSLTPIKDNKFYIGSLLGMLPRAIFLVSTAIGAKSLIELIQ